MARLLVIEDETAFQEYVATCLPEHTVVGVQRLSEALEHLQTDDPKWDGIVLDLNLLDSTGLDTLYAILDHSHTIPILVATSLPREPRMDALVRVISKERLADPAVVQHEVQELLILRTPTTNEE